MIPSTVNGKKAKNLGWLLRHWKEVESFTVTDHPPTNTGGMGPEAVLTAHLKQNSGTYETGFMSASVLMDFLHRPVFYDLPVTWKQGSMDKAFILNKGTRP